jgi:hypothetical protein
MDATLTRRLWAVEPDDRSETEAGAQHEGRARRRRARPQGGNYFASKVIAFNGSTADGSSVVPAGWLDTLNT